MSACLVRHFHSAAISSRTNWSDYYGSRRGCVIQRILLSVSTDFAKPERIAGASILLVGIYLALCRRPYSAFIV